MKSLKCSEVSGMHCRQVIRGSTSEDVKSKMLAHGIRQHPRLMRGMSVEDKQRMMEKMDNKIIDIQKNN